MLDRAETVLHDNFGGIEYWEARRSMRFAHKLVEIANQFRKDNLDSDDVRDNTVLADSWEDHRYQHHQLNHIGFIDSLVVCCFAGLNDRGKGEGPMPVSTSEGKTLSIPGAIKFPV